MIHSLSCQRIAKKWCKLTGPHILGDADLTRLFCLVCELPIVQPRSIRTTFGMVMKWLHIANNDFVGNIRSPLVCLEEVSQTIRASYERGCLVDVEDS